LWKCSNSDCLSHGNKLIILVRIIYEIMAITAKQNRNKDLLSY